MVIVFTNTSLGFCTPFLLSRKSLNKKRKSKKRPNGSLLSGEPVHIGGSDEGTSSSEPRHLHNNSDDDDTDDDNDTESDDDPSLDRGS